MYWLMRSASSPPVSVVPPRNSTGLSLLRLSAPTVWWPECRGWRSRSSVIQDRLERVTDLVVRAAVFGLTRHVAESDQRLRAAILTLARERGPAKSICPSDAARAVGGENWRDLMDGARDAARDLAKSGDVEITQGGDVVDPDATWRGPIRIRAR